MKGAEIRTDLLNKIEMMSIPQLKELYGVIQNYFNGKAEDEWSSMGTIQKEKIEKGIAQADTGMVKPVGDVTKKLRLKYGIDG